MLQYTADNYPSRPSEQQSVNHRATTNCNTVQRTATHCNALQRTATHCNTLQHTATHCNALQRTATHCNALQHIATHSNTLQHTATHHNTLLPLDYPPTPYSQFQRKWDSKCSLKCKSKSSMVKVQVSFQMSPLEKDLS